MLELILLGTGVGVLSGFFGIGGGTILVPLLLMLGYETKAAIGISVLQMVFSSIYGSYDYETNVDIPDNAIVRFFCPVCGKELKSESKCDVCNAPMIPINLEEGGRVRFCSRKGCTNHVIEFKNPELALKLLYDNYSYNNKNTNEINFKRIEEILKKQVKKDNAEKEIISKGTYLYTYCPHCKHTLIKDNMIELAIINKDGEKGILRLSPYLNVFSHE